MNRSTMLSLVLLGSLVLGFSGSQGPAHAGVEPNWPAGKPNQCRNDSDTFIDFEQGIDGAQIQSSVPSVEFTNTNGLDWQYADKRTGKYNIYPYGTGKYECNGNFAAWLGTTGDAGRITFVGGTATYVSVLVSTYSGVVLEAYDEDGHLIATSGRADNNLGTRTMTRLTVEGENIAYVVIHDTGNYWLMDDLCTDAQEVCIMVDGYGHGEPGERMDVVFVPDDDYGAPEDIDSWLPEFLEHVRHKIDDRLGGQDPVSGNLNKFNFYYTRLQGSINGTHSAENCGRESSVPEDVLHHCSFADAIVVLHRTRLGDCSTVGRHPNIYSAEGELSNPRERSFIHESGHGLFGLADEYDSSACRTYYFEPSPMPNIWTTEAACREDARREGWNPDDCHQFTTCQGGWWKVQQDDYIMVDGSYFDNGWGDPAARRIQWVLDQFNGKGVKGDGRSVRLKLHVDDGGMTEQGKDFATIPAPNYVDGTGDMVAKVYSIGGALLGQYNFMDPRRIIGEDGYEGPTMRDSADFILTLPHFPKGERVDIVNRDTGEVMLSVDISGFIDPQAETNEPPIAVAGPDQVAECEGPAGTHFDLDGSESSDPEGETVSCSWRSSTCEFSAPDQCVTSATCPYGENLVTLVVNDGEQDSEPDEVVLTVVDTHPPTGTITSPAEGACLQPPVEVRDNYTDVCSEELEKSYEPGPGPVYVDDGAYDVVLTVTDVAGNSASSEVTFIVDGTPPVVNVFGVPSMEQDVPREQPLGQYFSSSDEDMAPGGVVAERLLVDGCVVYDGNVYGDGDGLLSDETVGVVRPMICDMYRACGKTRFENPVFVIEAEDCAGNVTRVEKVVPGTYVVDPGGC